MTAFDIDSGLWHAIAGSPTRVPSVNSHVYYFPRGHIENSSQNNELIHTCPPILCKVLYVRYLCTNSDNQAFAKYLLIPICRDEKNNRNIGNNVDLNNIVSFSKTITASDASTNGSLFVPKSCVDSIFPRLTFSNDPPTQTLKMFDAHHNAYEFTHIYRGTPRRHVLTTGWSQFVKGKNLRAGDSIVFMHEKSTGQRFIGVRRWRFTGDEGFSAYRVRHAIEKAGKGEAFEVEYYPRMGMPNFVVRAEKVVESMKREWRVGMRVRMVAEAEDLSRMGLLEGTIESVGGEENNNYPWGRIQVTWDEPEILKFPIRVSPWQVECVEPSEEGHQLPFSPPFKKQKTPISLPNKEDDFTFPDLTQSASTHNSATFNGSPFSSMQGASPDNTHDVSDYHNGTPFRSFNHLQKNGKGVEPRHVSAVRNLGSTSRFENAPPASSFQLFGQIIHIQGETEGNNVLSNENGQILGMQEDNTGLNSQDM